ncbi:MAG: ATP-binding cassette domain-containing protein, partial [Candidatus Bathyarchaeia archaeon]
MSVEIRNLTVTYFGNDFPSLKDINLKIEEGERVAILGPSGSGKTTLILTLNGAIPEEVPALIEGEVIIDGLSTKDHGMSQLSRIVGIVLDEPSLQIFALTVEDDVIFGPSNLGLPRDEIIERYKFALKATRLEGFEKRNTMSLSGGEQQSLVLAGVLAMKPKVMALDEPISKLDPIGKDKVFSTLKAMSDRYKTTCIITESGLDLEYLTDYVHRIIVLYNGKILLDDTPEKVLASDVVDKIGVGRPPIMDLSLKLRKNKGINIPSPLNLNMVAQYIRDYVKKSGRTISSPSSLEMEKFIYGNDKPIPLNPIIKVKNLHHIYPATPPIHALKGVSLEIYPGEMVGIIGQNGSGKTTLALHLVGVLKPSNPDAEIIVDGKDVTKIKPKDIGRYINYVFQNPNLQLFAKNVYEEVAYGLRMHGLSEEEISSRVSNILEVFDISDIQEKPIMTLSANERVFVAIASVMVLNPKVLILDEPTCRLDRHYSEKLLKILLDFNKKGLTILLISHHMEHVAKFCRRVILMARGEILIDGPTKVVFSKPEILEKES